MGDLGKFMADAKRQTELRQQGRVVKQKTDIELDTLDPAIARDLLSFHITRQKIADHANVDFSEPWQAEVAYSTWHRALDSKPVWIEIVQALEDLESETTKNPRQFLPGPPDYDDLASWMRKVGALKWWHGVLQPECSLSVLTAWSSRGSMKQAHLEDLKQRVADWWERVDAACARADTVRRFDAARRVEDDAKRTSSRVASFDTWISDKIEDGMALDEARNWFLNMRSELEYSRLDMIDLTDPKDPLFIYEGEVWDRGRALDCKSWVRWFDERAATGFPLAVSRQMPEGTDLTPYAHEGQWKDRRYEESLRDKNDAIYKMHYREKVKPYWCTETREVQTTTEIVAVSSDGQDWRKPTEREKQGWIRSGDELAVYRFANDGESPENEFYSAIGRIKDRIRSLENMREDPPLRRAPHLRDSDDLEKAIREAEKDLAEARANY